MTSDEVDEVGKRIQAMVKDLELKQRKTPEEWHALVTLRSALHHVGIAVSALRRGEAK